MYKKSITHYVTKIIVDILFYLSIVCTLISPFVSDWLFGWISYPYPNYLPYFTAILFLSGICVAYILFNLKHMYRSLLVGNPFVDKNVSHLRKMAVACVIISVMYFIKCIFLFTIATFLIAAVFMIACLFCLTLKDLFKQAINYKTENELTI